MNLYEIMLEHYSQKDSQQGIYTYLVAESDIVVYDWICSEHTLKDGRVFYNSYKEQEEYGKTFTIYNNNYDAIGEETLKERMIRLKGDMYDEDKQLDDLYYGATLVGWKLIKEDIAENEVSILQGTWMSIDIA